MPLHRSVAALVAALVATGLTVPLAGSVIAAPPHESARAVPRAQGYSHPVEDSYYPDKGDPGVDVLHYGLDLTWVKAKRQLRGVAAVRFRATASKDRFQLDLAKPMHVSKVTVGGLPVHFRHRGKTLVVSKPVHQGRHYAASVTYAGTPRPAKGPATRSDVAHVGMRVTKSRQLWTMQEPYGAFTWYPSNDQPSDKALYDVRVDAPGSWVGVSNGRLVSRRTADNRTVTVWTNKRPMSTYLVTLAVGPYRRYQQTGPHGLPMTYWVLRNHTEQVKPLKRTPATMRWLENRLGRYPFDRVGILVTPSDSAMETQTLVTLGAKNYKYGNRYVRRTVVHELAHQWYGDTVTPRDWRDLWMNEGMATYQDTRWAAAQGWTTWRHWQKKWKRDDELWRDVYGPPGKYHHGQFGSNNVYYCTALMWDRLRQRVGTARFNRLVKAWPHAHPYSNQSRADLVHFYEKRTGKELSGFFHTWLMSKKSPA